MRGSSPNKIQILMIWLKRKNSLKHFGNELAGRWMGFDFHRKKPTVDDVNQI